MAEGLGDRDRRDRGPGPVVEPRGLPVRRAPRGVGGEAAPDAIPVFRPAHDAASAAGDDGPPPLPPAPLPPRVEHRFRFVLGALLGLGLAALVLAAALVLGGSHDEQRWSAFEPTGEVDEKIEQIIDHVEPRYRGLDGRPLADVSGGLPRYNGTLVNVVVDEERNGRGTAPAGGLVYQLCGLGEDCALTGGAPSEERLALLRRESLELALYTFKYVDDVDRVITLLPGTEDRKAAVVVDRELVEGQLRNPLAATLPDPVPTIETVDGAPGQTAVDEATGGLLTYTYKPAPYGTGVVLLTPPDRTDQLLQQLDRLAGGRG